MLPYEIIDAAGSNQPRRKLPRKLSDYYECSAGWDQGTYKLAPSSCNVVSIDGQTEFTWDKNFSGMTAPDGGWNTTYCVDNILCYCLEQCDSNASKGGSCKSILYNKDSEDIHSTCIPYDCGASEISDIEWTVKAKTAGDLYIAADTTDDKQSVKNKCTGNNDYTTQELNGPYYYDG